jgi:hypothetical protein
VYKIVLESPLFGKPIVNDACENTPFSVEAVVCMGYLTSIKPTQEDHFNYFQVRDKLYIKYSDYDASCLTESELWRIGFPKELMSLRKIYRFGLQSKLGKREFWVRCFKDESFGTVPSESTEGMFPFLIVVQNVSYRRITSTSGYMVQESLKTVVQFPNFGK